jgi:hypothetical protein
MSKSSELDRAVKLYILDSIDCEGTHQEKIDYVKECFNTEYGWMIPKAGEIDSLASWLQGLPSALDLPYWNHAIIELAKEWGSIPEDATEKQEDKILENYWNFIANKLSQLMNGYRIPKEG